MYLGINDKHVRQQVETINLLQKLTSECFITEGLGVWFDFSMTHKTEGQIFANPARETALPHLQW